MDSDAWIIALIFRGLNQGLNMEQIVVLIFASQKGAYADAGLLISVVSAYAQCTNQFDRDELESAKLKMYAMYGNILRHFESYDYQLDN